MKGIVSISLDTTIIENLRIKRINISQLINNLLNSYLNTQEKQSLEKLEEKQKLIEIEKLKLKNQEEQIKKQKEEIEKLNSIEKKEQEIKEEEIRRNNQEKAEEECYKKINYFLDNLTDEQKAEFLEGRLTKKWSGITEYTKFKLNLK